MITLAQDLDFYLTLYSGDEAQAVQAILRNRPTTTTRDIALALIARDICLRYPLTAKFLAEAGSCK